MGGHQVGRATLKKKFKCKQMIRAVKQLGRWGEGRGKWEREKQR